MKTSSAKSNGSIVTSIESERSRKPIGISSRKAKGRKLQDYVVISLRSHFKACNPTLNDLRLNLGIKPAIMGESGCDVKITDLDFRNIFPFGIECKNHERWNMSKFWDQTLSNCPDDLFPLLILKRNRGKVYCFLEFDTLLEVLRR